MTVSESTAASNYSQEFEPVRIAEQAWTARRREVAGIAADADSVGLAFSGGGIRSATFNLGVLQALEAGGMLRHVDYLSSVSGGGYVASCYSWLRSRLSAERSESVFVAHVEKSGGDVLDWLRGHGKFLVSHRGFSLWTLIASIFAATFVNLLVLGPPLLAIVDAMTLGWLPVSWPTWLVLPGGHVPQAHHGYWLLLALGATSLALFPIVATLFAVIAGVPRLANVQRVDRLRVLMGRMISIGLVLIAIGLIPIAATLGEMAEHLFAMRYAGVIGKHAAELVPIVGGIASMLFDRRKGGDNSGRMTTIGLSLLVYGLLILCYHVAVSDDWLHAPIFLGLLVLSAILAVLCNINRVSIHAYYRARLSEAFLPRIAGVDETSDPGNFDLRQLNPDHGAPLQLINTTLNTTSSKNEKLSSREGASFFLSALYAGSSATGYRRIASYADGDTALSNAFTTSGAAIDPDMVDTRARSVSFLMALFNVRLGYWALNPKFADRRVPWWPWWWIFIGREMLGVGLDETRRHVHLSDGGGFENLGIYELIRRRVRYLVVTDAGADPMTTLGDLGRAIERVRVDFGAAIDLDPDRLYRQRDDHLAQRPFLLGSIRYADGSTGRILYIKPRLCAGLTADIYAYWRANPAFPDEPTSEQFFAEPQFEAYRALGQQIIKGLLGETPPRDIEAWFEHVQAMQAATD